MMPKPAFGRHQKMLDNNQTHTTAALVATVTINGQPVELAMPATVATLLEARQPRPPFAVELNKRLVRRSAYATTPISNGDHLEIVTLVGGG